MKRTRVPLVERKGIGKTNPQRCGNKQQKPESNEKNFFSDNG